MIKNKRAYFDYEILWDCVAGIQLIGSEVKPLRKGDANISQAHCYVKDGEVFIKNMFIAENKNAKHYAHEPLRERKLLLTKKQIEEIEIQLQVQGMTLIPLLISEHNSHLKLKIGVGRGKKAHDKREDIKKKDQERELKRKF